MRYAKLPYVFSFTILIALSSYFYILYKKTLPWIVISNNFNFINSHKEYKKINFISGHRGTIEKELPENSIISILETLKYTPAFFEVDPRYSKDKEIFLMHDENLVRTTDSSGNISDKYSTQLKKINLKNNKGNITNEKIPSLREVINLAKSRFILNLDITGVPTEELYYYVKKEGGLSNTFFTIHSAEQAKSIQKIDKNAYLSIHISNLDKYREFKEKDIYFGKSIVYIGPKLNKSNLDLISVLNKENIFTMISTATSLDKHNFQEKEYLKIYKSNVKIIETDYPIRLSKIIKN